MRERSELILERALPPHCWRLTSEGGEPQHEFRNVNSSTFNRKFCGIEPAS